MMIEEVVVTGAKVEDTLRSRDARGAREAAAARAERRLQAEPAPPDRASGVLRSQEGDYCLETTDGCLLLDVAAIDETVLRALVDSLVLARFAGERDRHPEAPRVVTALEPRADAASEPDGSR